MLPPKSMKGIFGDLVLGRQESKQEQHRFGVFPLTKSGNTTKRPSSTFRTEGEADSVAKEMTVLNNKQFIVLRL